MFQQRNQAQVVLLLVVLVVSVWPSLQLFQISLSTPVDIDAGEGLVTYPIEKFLTLREIYSDFTRKEFFYPAIYPPLHFLIAQLVAGLSSLHGLLAGRWVSLASAIIGSVGLFFLARRLGARKFYALFFCVLPFVLNPLANFIALNQPDVPAAVVAVWGVYSLVSYFSGFHRLRIDLVLSALLLSLAVFFQQRMIVVMVASMVFFVMQYVHDQLEVQDVLVFIMTSALVAGLLVGLLHRQTDGFIWSYLIVLPSGHPLSFDFALKVIFQAFVMWGGFYVLTVVLAPYSKPGVSFLAFVWVPILCNFYFTANIGASTNYFLVPTLMSMPVIAAGLSHRGLHRKLRLLTVFIVVTGMVFHAYWNYFHKLPQVRSFVERRTKSKKMVKALESRIYVNGYYSSLITDNPSVHFAGFPFWISKYSLPSIFEKHRLLLLNRVRRKKYTMLLMKTRALFPLNESFIEKNYRELPETHLLARAYGKVYVREGTSRLEIKP